MKHVLAWVLIGLLWLLHWLPLGVQAALGRGLGWVLYKTARSRRHVVQCNLALCLPELSAAEGEVLGRAQFG